MNTIKIFIQDWLQNAEVGYDCPEIVKYMECKVEEWTVLKRKLSLIQ